MADIPLTMRSRVRVATPCPMAWEDLSPTGAGDAVRYCGTCRLNVHNIALMTTAEAEAFFADHFAPDGTARRGRVCAQLYRRADGTIITRDCAAALTNDRAVARRVAAAAVAAGLLPMAACEIHSSREVPATTGPLLGSIVAPVPAQDASSDTGWPPDSGSVILGGIRCDPVPPDQSPPQPK